MKKALKDPCRFLWKEKQFYLNKVWNFSRPNIEKNLQQTLEHFLDIWNFKSLCTLYTNNAITHARKNLWVTKKKENWKISSSKSRKILPFICKLPPVFVLFLNLDLFKLTQITIYPVFVKYSRQSCDYTKEGVIYNTHIPQNLRSVFTRNL